MDKPRLDDETLAAFLDGRLIGKERERVIEVLANSPADYEAFVETASQMEGMTRLENHARVWAEEEKLIEAAGTPGWRVAIQRVTQRPVLAAAAVLVLLTLPAIPQILRILRGPARIDAIRVTTALVKRSSNPSILIAERDRPRWSITRGPASALSAEQIAFRLGFRQVDLALAAGLSRFEDAQLVIAEQLPLLEALELSGLEMRTLREIRDLADRSGPADSLLDLVEFSDERLDRLLSSDHFDFGKWCGAARLAAAARDVTFFTSGQTARFLRARRWPGLPTPVTQRLDRIAALVENDLQEREFEQVQQHLAAVIRQSGG